MLKSCSSCGRIHDSKYICPQKAKAIANRQKKFKTTNKDKFRWTTVWQSKREEIRVRDKQLCQICIRKLYNTINQYTYDNLSVHHAESLENAWEKRLDNDNLLTVCVRHHEMAENGEIPTDVVLNIIAEQESKVY